MSGPTNRHIQHLLKHDADQVTVPDGMWEKIALRIEQEPRPAKNRSDRKNRWGQVIFLSVCAAAFWMMVQPSNLEVVGVVPPVTDLPDRGEVVSVAAGRPEHPLLAGSPATGTSSLNSTSVDNVAH